MSELDPERVANYMGHALGEAAERCCWPDDARGSATRLLVQDLGEFGSAMVACGRADFWSPAHALERMWLERFEALMGVADSAFAKRYLKSATEPNPQNPLRPKRKARPEDAMAAFGKASDLPPEEIAVLRTAFLSMKDAASDWFVHPTAIGPLASRAFRMGSQDPTANWIHVVQLLSLGCYWTIQATVQLNVAVTVELLKALHAGVQMQEHAGSLAAPWMRELLEGVVTRARVLDSA